MFKKYLDIIFLIWYTIIDKGSGLPLKGDLDHEKTKIIKIN